MLAIYDENPYPRDSLSYKIWDRNEKIGTGRIRSASDAEKYILYLYVMGKCIKEISERVGLSRVSVSLLLDKYHIKL